MAGKHLETLPRTVATTGVDPRDEPSAEWGWHGQFPRVTRATGWLMVVFLLSMLVGNHRGNVENIWLVVLAVGVVYVLVRDAARRRTAWRK